MSKKCIRDGRDRLGLRHGIFNVNVLARPRIEIFYLLVLFFFVWGWIELCIQGKHVLKIINFSFFFIKYFLFVLFQFCTVYSVFVSNCNSQLWFTCRVLSGTNNTNRLREDDTKHGFARCWHHWFFFIMFIFKFKKKKTIQKLSKY